VSWYAGSGPILTGRPAEGRRSQTMCGISSFGWGRRTSVGMRADQGRAGQARHQGLGLVDPSAPSTRWARAGTTTRRSDLGGVPAQPGMRDPGAGLLHRRDHLAPNALRLFRHRAPHAACPSGWCHRAPRLRLGHAGCPQPLVGPARAGTVSLPDQGPRLQVHEELRRGFRRGGHRSHPHPVRAVRRVCLTGRSSSAGAISNGRSAKMSPTTTQSGCTAESTCESQSRRRIPPHRFPVSGACEEGDVLGGLIHEYELVA
jgi:hypothetical protein